MLILPLSTIAAYLNDGFVLNAARHADYDIQLLATLSRYSPAMPKQGDDPGPRLQVFPWDDLNGFALDLGFVLLVYDESDEIALPASERSKAWQARVAGTQLECKLTGVEHAFGHYYFVGRAFDC